MIYTLFHTSAWVPIGRSRMLSACLALFVYTAVVGTAGDVHAQGLIIPGAGAANRSMGGASTAAPLDAAGAGYWNPAAIRGLSTNQVYFGAELAYADTKLSSSIPAGAIGPGLPPTDRSGQTYSNSGLPVLPTTALVYHPEDSQMSVGLGIYGLAGAAVNFAGGSTPVLTPQDPPNTFGFGPQYASATVFQIAPMLAYEVTDRLVLGAGPMVDTMIMSLDPAFFGPRNPNGTFPPATNGRPTWGGGFQAGLLFEYDCCWNFGAAYKSPQWFETFKYNSKDETGARLDLELDLTLPAIISIGTGYYGFDNMVIAADLRWFDYSSTTLFGDSPADGGLGWNSVFAAAIGVQYQCTDTVSVRAGYMATENPIPTTATLFNTQVPAINRHQISFGASKQLTESITLDLTGLYGFHSSITGPIAQIPGANVSLGQDILALMFGIRVDFW